MTPNYIPIENLIIALDWLRIQRRESILPRFFLFRIGFDDPQVLGSAFGAPDATRRLSKFGTASLAGGVQCRSQFSHTANYMSERSSFTRCVGSRRSINNARVLGSAPKQLITAQCNTEPGLPQPRGAAFMKILASDQKTDQ